MSERERIATISRDTAETQIELTLNIDGSGKCDVETGIPFFEHMLTQISKHGMLDLQIKASGDIDVDAHHTVEDVGIVFGQALSRAAEDKSGVYRYGHAYVPLDESLSRVVVDLSGRPGLFYNVDYVRPRVGEFDLDLLREFFQGLVNHGMLTLHLDNLKGENAHHQAETLFKAFGRALRMALSRDSRSKGEIPSTKGSL
jgi:imidazoleglycerol-phosphate dehydratase